MRAATASFLMLAALVPIGCGSKRDVVVSAPTAGAPCDGLIDLAGRRVSAPVRWYPPPDEDERRRLAAWCDTIGPGVLDGTPDEGATSDHIAIVSWNVHVGGGQLATVIRELRAGRLTDGTAPGGFVLLLQEAFRSGPAVPETTPNDAPVPRRIEGASPAGTRDDVVAVAAQEGLALFYLPSMRNGREANGRSEDRGNAILSTFDLTDPAAVELPLFRQRRVAVAATVSGMNPAKTPWRLRVVSVHLDASTGPRAVWLFTSAQRERQAQYLADVLDESPIATVVGGDLNTWAGGTREPAFIELRRGSSAVVIGPRFARWLTLDYVFFRLPASWQTDSFTAGTAFGSDHRPVVTRIRLGA